MSSTLLKVRSERISKNYEIIWEIPKFEEVCGAAAASDFKNEKKTISKFLLDTTFSPSQLPVKWSIEIARTLTDYFVFMADWDFQDVLQEEGAEDEICAQFILSTLSGEQFAFLMSQSFCVMKRRESKLLGHIMRESRMKQYLQSSGQLTLKIQFKQFDPSSFQFFPEIESLRVEGVSKCLEDFSSLLASGRHSDFCVKADGGVSYKVHKAILAARSSVLSRMLSSGMEESAKGEMIVNDISSQTLNVVLQFLYSGKVDEKLVNVDNVEELVYAADKYDLPLIKETVSRLLHTFCVVDNAMSLWKTSKLFGLKAAEEQINLFVQRNILEVFKVSMDIENKKPT